MDSQRIATFVPSNRTVLTSFTAKEWPLMIAVGMAPQMMPCKLIFVGRAAAIRGGVLAGGVLAGGMTVAD